MTPDKHGFVIKSTGKSYKVKSTDNTFFECSLKGKFRIKGIKTTNPLAVGDRVVFSQQDDQTDYSSLKLHYPKIYKTI